MIKMAFSPDGALLAAADAAGMVHLIRAGDAVVERVIEAGGASAIQLLAWSVDGTLLAIQRADGTAQVWRVDEGQLLATLAAAPDDTRLIFTADNQMAITAGPRGVAFYRLRDGALLHTLPVAAEDIAIGPRRRLLALLHAGQVQLWGIG
jgi:WD40 repeat protein